MKPSLTASNRQEREKAQCSGKVRFTSQALAREAANRNPDRGHRKPYRCKFCGGIHLATTSRGRRLVDRRPMVDD